MDDDNFFFVFVGGDNEKENRFFFVVLLLAVVVELGACSMLGSIRILCVRADEESLERKETRSRLILTITVYFCASFTFIGCFASSPSPSHISKVCYELC